MQELVGRLTALDPAASESLKVVAYFDALVTAGVGVDGLLRATAALSGTVAGAERRGRTRRFDPTGKRLDDEGAHVRAPERTGPGFSVWLEREGEPHANDAMVVERLALSVELFDARGGPASGLDIALDASRSLDDRTEALARLRVNVDTRVRIVASPVDDPAPGAPSTVVPTRYGLLRATLDTSGSVAPTGRGGLGAWVRADHAPDSWEGAVVAYRIGDRADPVVDADTLGAMVLLARAHDPEHPHPDVLAIDRLDPLEASIVRTLIETDSIRSAAARLGMHHSTVQARHEALTRELGYDPRTPQGRMRYVAALILWRLDHPDPSGREAPDQ